MAFPITGTTVTVPDTYEVIALKQDNADPTIQWANTYTIKATPSGPPPGPTASIFLDIIAFELGILYKDASLVSLTVRLKVFGKVVGSINLPLFTIPVNQAGHNDAPPIGAGAPNPVGGEVVIRLKKLHQDGSRARYNFYRNATDKNSVVAQPGGHWALTAFGIPGPINTATLLGTTLNKDLFSVLPLPPFTFFSVHAHKGPPLGLGTPPIWTVSGDTAVSAFLHAGVSTAKLTRKSHR